jgi:outer membrane biogenesis lipoprotein LolB
VIRLASILAALVLAGCATVGSEQRSARREQVEWLADQLVQAYDRFDSGNFTACIATCDRILDRSPGLATAKELREDAILVQSREKVLK